jgi:hypothetical protein
MGFTVLGGELKPAIEELRLVGVLPVTDEQVQENTSAAQSRGLPTWRDIPKANHPRLAVVGGGASIYDHLERLQTWEGDVWAINGACRWCHENGIKATFFAADPHPIVAKWAAESGATKALLCSTCDASAFEVLKNADVTLYELGVNGIWNGSSTAMIAPHLAIECGYKEISFFGCESSYPIEKTHAYMHETRPEQLVVRCGGKDFLTAPDFYVQARELSEMCRLAPHVYVDRSGGLLRAMVSDPAHEIVWISEAMFKTMTPVNHDPQPDQLIAAE